MSRISKDLFHRIFGAAAAPVVAEPCYSSRADREVLLALCRAFHPRVVVEIGIQRGRTAKMILDACPWVRCYFGIDVPPGTGMALAGQQPEVPDQAGDLVADDRRVKLLVPGRGSRGVTPRDVGAADLVFIDGDHSAAAVAADTALARAVLRPGGVCVWHDYGNPTVEVTGVIDALNRNGGDRICHVEGSWVCFEIRPGRDNP